MDPAGACLVADSWSGPAPMWLLEPMNPRELRCYVHALLSRVDGRAGEAPFDDTGLARLHARSAGVPSQVNTEAARLLSARPLR